MKRKDYQKPLTEVVALDFDEVMCLPGASQIDNDGDGGIGAKPYRPWENVNPGIWED